MATWQGFYSTAQVSRLAGVPKRTLYHWKARGIVTPSIQIVGAGGQKDEGYSYADLAIAKLLRGLRNKQLNLRSVARTLRHLYERFGPPTSPGWEKTHVYVFDRVVYSQKPDEWETTVATQYGQKAMEPLVGDLFEEEASLLVPRDFVEFIEINPDIMQGMPVIRNTRIPTSIVSMMVEQGTDLDELEVLYAPTPRLCLERALDFERILDEATAVAAS